MVIKNAFFISDDLEAGGKVPFTSSLNNAVIPLEVLGVRRDAHGRLVTVTHAEKLPHPFSGFGVEGTVSVVNDGTELLKITDNMDPASTIYVSPGDNSIHVFTPDPENPQILHRREISSSPRTRVQYPPPVRFPF